jgi:hypothetical protein
VATALTATTPEPETEEQLAARYAGDLAYRALLSAGEPLKASEVVRAIGRPDVDLKLARVVLSTNPNMTATDRKWTLWTRYLDTRNTVDRNIQRILDTFGQPIRLPELARELQSVYGRPAEIYEEMLARLAAEGSRFFRVGRDYIAPVNWLLDVAWEDEDEVLYDNFIADEDVFPLEKAAVQAGLNAHKPETVAAFLDAVGSPVKNKALQFLAWRTDKEHFDPAAFYSRVFLESGATALSNGTWIGPKLTAALVSHFPVLAEQEVSDNAEAEAQEAAQPLTIGDAERNQLVQAVLDSDGTVHAARLLEETFEVTPDYRTYAEDLQTTIQALASDDRIVWVGSDRFRPQGTIPGYVFSVPGILEIPTTNFTDAEGNPVDLMLEDDGFDGGLEREILNPLAQDVLDEEPVPRPDPNPPSNARAVIKYHHKEIGTLPLCLFPSGFFPPEPTILEVEFTLPGGQKAQVWVNNETRLLYGLLDWFQSIPIDSGATFTLERQAPDRFLVNYNEESEPTMFISRNRINELLALHERAEAEGMSAFEIMQEIMEHYRKGIEYLTLLTEVNIVRRTTRRLIASVLSEYHCFFQRGGAWVYDAKKLSQGFDKSKRKYLVK